MWELLWTSACFRLPTNPFLALNRNSHSRHLRCHRQKDYFCCLTTDSFYVPIPPLCPTSGQPNQRAQGCPPSLGMSGNLKPQQVILPHGKNPRPLLPSLHSLFCSRLISSPSSGGRAVYPLDIYYVSNKFYVMPIGANVFHPSIHKSLVGAPQCPAGIPGTQIKQFMLRTGGLDARTGLDRLG